MGLTSCRLFIGAGYKPHASHRGELKFACMKRSSLFIFLFNKSCCFVKLRTLKMHQCPSRSSDSSVSCVWSSCSTAPRESVTCCGPSSSLSRSLSSRPLSSFLYYLLLTVLVFCLQALPHVALLIVMLFFIYAVIGMQVLPVPV